MKTGFKIAIIISSFAVFYFALIPILQICHNTDSNCTVWQEFMLVTRPVVPGELIGVELEWGGTPEGIESPSIERLIMDNMSFVVSMIVLPLVIIGFVVGWDKRR